MHCLLVLLPRITQALNVSLLARESSLCSVILDLCAILVAPMLCGHFLSHKVVAPLHVNTRQ